MNLTEVPEIINWPVTHYVYVEKIGPFQETAPKAWGELIKAVPTIEAHNKVTGHLSLYKVDPKRMLYRAGVSLVAAPVKLPNGLGYVKFNGGKYAKFVLTGAWSNLPAACGRVFEIVAQAKIPRRDDFCVEHYANDPKVTPEEKLITEILIPTL